MKPELVNVELYAWVGMDELGSGEIGLKQGICPAGVIPMVSLHRKKLERFWSQAEGQAKIFGERIYLCRFALVEVLLSTKEGRG